MHNIYYMFFIFTVIVRILERECRLSKMGNRIMCVQNTTENCISYFDNTYEILLYDYVGVSRVCIQRRPCGGCDIIRLLLSARRRRKTILLKRIKKILATRHPPFGGDAVARHPGFFYFSSDDNCGAHALLIIVLLLFMYYYSLPDVCTRAADRPVVVQPSVRRNVIL